MALVCEAEDSRANTEEVVGSLIHNSDNSPATICSRNILWGQIDWEVATRMRLSRTHLSLREEGRLAAHDL